MSATGVLELLALLGLLNESGKMGPGPPGPPAPYVGPGEPQPSAPIIPSAPPVVPSVVVPIPPAPPVAPPVPIGPIAPPAVLPPMPAWPAAPVPGSLPPFPGPGWVPDEPVTATVAARAAYWNPQLWDYTNKTIRKAYVQEQFGGSWVTFSAAWHPGASGPQTYMATEAWRIASAPPIAPPTTPVGPVAPAPTPTPGMLAKPAPVSPYPGTGAYASNAPYILRYQTALAYLAQSYGFSKWNPGALDGKYGPNTVAAVRAFQGDQSVSPVDGMCGAATAAALDKAMGYGAPPGTVPVIVPPASAAPSGPPSLVSPYPGPGAYSNNPAYITRYQNALTWLAHTALQPAWDPKGVDGKYGPNTIAAVKAFQAAHGLSPVDGMAGAATAAAIDASLTAQPAAA